MRFVALLSVILLSACVDRVFFSVPPAQFQTVVEGMISDKPGPYFVRISRSLSLEEDSVYRPPVEHASVKLYDNGEESVLTETSPGVYATDSAALLGTIGHSYFIRIETAEGKLIESEPETIKPGGEVKEIRYEFEARTVKRRFGTDDASIFNIYVDGEAGPGDDHLVRWQFRGTYKVLSYPEFHFVWAQGYFLLDPFPCSGVRVGTPVEGVKYVRFGPCSCCICWAKHFETAPQVSDGQFINGDQFKNIKVAEVPITSATFYEQYLVEVDQMSLSRNAFDFFRLVRAQKLSASSLFQPPSGEIRGNVKAVNSNESVVGIFWATSIKTTHLFIPRSAVPFNLTPIDTVTTVCTWYPNSSLAKPDLWP